MLTHATPNKDSSAKNSARRPPAPKSPPTVAPEEKKQEVLEVPKFSWNFGDIRASAPGENVAPPPGEHRRRWSPPWQIAKPLPWPLQAKLKVGAVDDPLEREADRVAEQVMRISEPAALRHVTTSDGPTASRDAPPTASHVSSGIQERSTTSVRPATVQRKCSCGGSCDKCKAGTSEEDHGKVQRKPASARFSMPASAPTKSAMGAPPIVHEVLRSAGEPLDGQTRAYFEPRFQFDFSRVRLHADPAAAASARAVNAAAYAVGPHIVLGPAAPAPDTAAGQRLMAHELAHVVQQGQGFPLQPAHRDATSHGPHLSDLDAGPESPLVLHRSSDPVVMRTPLLTSTMRICKKVLKGEHVFHVSEGGVIVTTNATWEPSEEWQGSERPQCGSDEFNVELTQKGHVWDSPYGSCPFQMGRPYSKQWTDIPEDDYYLIISTNNTNPNCCLEGDVEVSQQKGLSGDSCTQPPPGPLEMLHDALTIAGMIPTLGAIPDAVNAGIYVIQGDWTNAGISAIAMIPIFGEAASVAQIGERTVLKVSGEAIEKVGSKEMGAAFKEAKAAQAAKVAREAEAAKAASAIAEEIKLSKEEYEAALKMVFPSQYVDPVARLVDDIGQKAAKRAMENPRFVKAIEGGNWTLAGTFFHTAAKEEARAVPAALLPKGWALEAEKTLRAGAGGSRLDVFLRGPGGELVEFDWKTSGRSALSSGSRKEMAKHAGEVRVKLGSNLTTQESRSWFDYVRPLLGG